MASSSPTEIESLRRQHNSLTFQLARVTREHELELCAKDKLRASIVLKRDKRYKKTGAELAAVRSDRAGLKRSLDKTTAQLQAKTHEAVCMSIYVYNKKSRHSVAKLTRQCYASRS